MASSSSSAALRARLEALRSVASLPPLSLAIAHVGDAVLRDVVADLAESCLREATPLVPCTDPAIRSLLEGSEGTLPGDGTNISASLHKLLSDEATQTAVVRRRAREALAPASADGDGSGGGSGGNDIFGNRHAKKQADAETIACTHCGQGLAANRFAPHLERCLLGKGRKRTRPT